MCELDIFARNIARLRREHGLCKKEMAKALKIGRRSMDRLDCGIFPPRLGVQTLLNAARYFGASVSSLLQDVDE